jgi:hypothetical protein
MCKLPPLILFEEYENDWSKYIEAVYQIFCEDLKYSKLRYNNERVFLKRHPFYHGKEKSFWHLTSEGLIEDQRLPSLRRCERVRWIRFVIENSNKSFVKIWKNTRFNKLNVCFAIESFEYIVILGERSGYYVFLSAYPVERERKRERFREEYECYKKQNPPL